MEMEEAALLAVVMEKGPQGRDMTPQEARKGQKRFSLGSPEGPALPPLGL